MIFKIRNEIDKYMQEIGEHIIIEVGLNWIQEEIDQLVGLLKI